MDTPARDPTALSTAPSSVSDSLRPCRLTAVMTAATRVLKSTPDTRNWATRLLTLRSSCPVSGLYSCSQNTFDDPPMNSSPSPSPSPPPPPHLTSRMPCDALCITHWLGGTGRPSNMQIFKSISNNKTLFESKKEK